ncbi:MAG: hypothetical protein WC323_03315, partial [Patescibacteria group bacterium]
ARRVDEGAIPFQETMRALQIIIECLLPTTMTVGGREYEILDFLQDGKSFVKSDVMVARAKKMNANLGEEDACHILVYQHDIPAALQGKVVFVFTDWRRPDDSGSVCYVYWGGGRWVRGWRWLDRAFGEDGRVLRRK